MKIRIVAVGTKMPDWITAGYREYEQRLRKTQVIELIEIPLAKRTKTTDIASAKAKEADAIEKHLRSGDHIVALEVEGKALSTPDVAEQLSRWQMNARDTTLLIGGPDGLDERLHRRVDMQWSLSRLTLPHPLVRLVLIEQIYRGLMINAGHPYHRD